MSRPTAGDADRPTFITDIDLDFRQPLSPLRVDAGYAAVQATVRVHGAPVGLLSLPVAGATISGAALAAAIVAQLDTSILHRLLVERLLTGGLRAVEHQPDTLLDHLPARCPDAWPAATVAVCTRDRADDMARCLGALAAVEYPAMEVLVIDNAPSDTALERLVRERHPGVRYIVEPRPGLDWARNRAILEARGDIVAFTDDDAVPEPRWLQAIVTPFVEDPDAACVLGLVRPDELETAAQQLFERHGGLGRGFVRRWIRVPAGDSLIETVNVLALGVGANMAFRRSVFERIGGFDPALDAGTASGAGGDIEMFARVLKTSHTLVYEPRAAVRHRHRRDRQSIGRQVYSWSKGTRAAAARVAQDWPDERWPMAVFGARLLALYFPGRIASALVGSGLDVGLVLADLRGLLTGAGPFRRAAANAVALRDQFASAPTLAEPPLPVPTALPHHLRPQTVDVATPLPASLPGTEEATRVHVTVLREGERIGSVTLAGARTALSRARLADAIVDACWPALADATRFRRALARRLQPPAPSPDLA